MNNKVVKTIGKYALLLTIFSFIDIAVLRYTDLIFDTAKNSSSEMFLVSLPVIIGYLLNIMTAILISFDKAKFSLTGKYSVLLTVIFRPIGVVIFLIYLINSTVKSESDHNIDSKEHTE
jgi:hypothetical protein